MRLRRPTLGRRGWRRVRRGLFSLVAGVVLSVVIAWGCALLPRTLQKFDPPMRPIDHRMYYLTEWDDSVGKRFVSFGYGYEIKVANKSLHRMIPPYAEEVFDRDSLGGLASPDLIDAVLALRRHGEIPTIVACGVPRRCLAGAAWIGGTRGPSFRATMQVRPHPTIGPQGLPRQNLPWERYHVPVFPMWRGLLENTVIYGVLTFGFVSCFSQIRALRRMKRGRCPACGFDLNGVIVEDICPECGDQIPDELDFLDEERGSGVAPG